MFGWLCLVASVDLLSKKNIVGWLVADTDLVWKKILLADWLTSQTNRVSVLVGRLIWAIQAYTTGIDFPASASNDHMAYRLDMAPDSVHGPVSKHT